MAAFAIILLVLFSWVSDFILKNLKFKKINSFNFLSLIFLFFSITCGPLIFVFNLGFNYFKITFWIIFTIVLVSIIILFLYFLIKNKNYALQIFKDIALKNGYISISIILIAILYLFIQTNFSDTLAYINLSSSYIKNEMLSFDNINPIELQYKIVSIYFTHAAFFENEIVAAYQYINPIIYFTFISILINEYNFNLAKDKYNKNFIILNLFFNFGLVILFWTISYFATSGNMLIQSSIILFFLINFKISKSLILSTISIYFLSSFSATGIINSLLISAAAILYAFFFLKFKTTIILIGLSFLGLSNFLPLIYQKEIGYIFIFVGYLIAGSILLLTKIKKINWNFVVFKNSKINSKSLFIPYWIISFLVILISVAFFGFVYQYKNNYFSLLVFLMLTLALIIFAFNFFSYKKQNIKQFDYIYLFLWILPLLAIAGFYIIGFGNNQSIWRVIYLNIGMGGPTDIILLFYFLIISFFTDIKFQLKEKINKKVKWIPNLFTCVFFVASIISLLGQTIIIEPPKIIFNSNVNKNLYYLNNSEIKALSNFSLKNNERINVVSDNPFYIYLKNASIKSDIYFRTSYYISNKSMVELTQPWFVSSYNFLGSIQFYNTINSNKISTNNENLLNGLKLLINEKQNEFNCIMLDKNTTYYNVFENYLITSNTFNLEYNSENLAIWGLNE